MWATAPGSSRAHAVRLEPARIRVPGVRLSMCGNVAWHRTADEAPLTMKRCALCLRALRSPMKESSPGDVLEPLGDPSEGVPDQGHFSPAVQDGGCTVSPAHATFSEPAPTGGPEGKDPT